MTGEETTSKAASPAGSLAKWAWLSVGAAVLTLVLKFGAYAITDSVGLLSDAVESSVNLAAAFTALFALWYSSRPVDRSHHYGHEKIEFFSAAVEGGLILFAAVSIFWISADRLIHPEPIEDLGLGIAISVVASVINFAVAIVLLRVARAHDSIVLEADSRHLMTDVWTTVGVIVAIVAVSLTGIDRLDPIIGIVIAANILRTGFKLLRASFDGLMDRALPIDEQERIRTAVEGELPANTSYHALRTRRAGAKRFVDLHVLVPGEMTVEESHMIATNIEASVATQVPVVDTTVHIEPLEEPSAWPQVDSSPVLAAGGAPFTRTDMSSEQANAGHQAEPESQSPHSQT